MHAESGARGAEEGNRQRCGTPGAESAEPAGPHSRQAEGGEGAGTPVLQAGVPHGLAVAPTLPLRLHPAEPTRVAQPLGAPCERGASIYQVYPASCLLCQSELSTLARLAPSQIKSAQTLVGIPPPDPPHCERASGCYGQPSDAEIIKQRTGLGWA